MVQQVRNSQLVNFLIEQLNESIVLCTGIVHSEVDHSPADPGMVNNSRSYIYPIGI